MDKISAMPSVAAIAVDEAEYVEELVNLVEVCKRFSLLCDKPLLLLKLLWAFPAPSWSIYLPVHWHFDPPLL